MPTISRWRKMLVSCRMLTAINTSPPSNPNPILIPKPRILPSHSYRPPQNLKTDYSLTEECVTPKLTPQHVNPSFAVYGASELV